MSLTVESVSVSRGGRCLLRDVSLEVRRGDVLAVLGPNGAGKSTLVNVIGGDVTADAGGVRLDGDLLTRLSDAEQARRRAVMAQAPSPVLGFTVEDVVRMGWVRNAERSSAEAGRVVRARLRDCGIAHLAARRFDTLSGGEQQRVAFARALVQIWQPEGWGDPRYLVLDEPTSSLDLVHQQSLLAVAVGHARAGAGVLVVLHDLNLAARFADRVALLKDGKLCCCDVPHRALDGARLSALFDTAIHVEHHRGLDRLVVLA